MILAGDVGGTKTILALYLQKGGEWVCCKKDHFVSADYDSFGALLDEFLSTSDNLNLQSICIGVAGPVVGGDCIATNLPWVLKRQGMAVQTGTKNIRLLNDLEATAWGVLGLPEKDFVELNPDAQGNKGNLAVLAAGTGLGEAVVVWTDEDYHIVATEGGHTDFAPRNELEIGLLRFLMELHPDHVSYERVVCGLGLVNIYQYLKNIKYAVVNKDVELRMENEDPASVISEKGAGEGDEDELCAKALKMFCEIYGAEAGNLALKCLPKAGVVLAGGIAAKNLSSMQRGDFMRGFLAKGRYREALQEISVKVCLNPEAALLGALTVAKRKKQ
ncbi:MAG: glucokinase [Methylococcaceae bacterium]|nr:glucokinase [Methylococcaceae bacterium]